MRLRPYHKPHRILVTGGAGYLGSVLVRRLLDVGLEVRVLDSFSFGEDSLESSITNPSCRLFPGDIRDASLVRRAMRGCDAIVHLAGIVGDPACDKDSQLALDVNLNATRALIEIARKRDCRFVFASSCSVYGASDLLLDENSPLNPLSVYARTKIDAENFLLSCRGANAGRFRPVVLRFGTLFGVSPQMRFDLVVNLFVARAAATGRITLFNEDQWRPFLHVEDAARAVLACLEAPPDIISGQVFNAGSPRLNLQIRDIGEAVRRMIPDTQIERIENHDDRRNYRVSFEKIRRMLGFYAEVKFETGIEEIYAALRADLLADAAAQNPAAHHPGRTVPHAIRRQPRLWHKASTAGQ